MRDENSHITLGDYGRLDNLDEVLLGFQPANFVVFNIKNNVMLNLKYNQFSCKESEECNAHLTHFMDACSKINPAGVSESDKRLRLFGYSLTTLAKDWRFPDSSNKMVKYFMMHGKEASTGGTMKIKTADENTGNTEEEQRHRGQQKKHKKPESHITKEQHQLEAALPNRTSKPDTSQNRHQPQLQHIRCRHKQQQTTGFIQRVPAWSAAAPAGQPPPEPTLPPSEKMKIRRNLHVLNPVKEEHGGEK
ncbi:hypothetical protein MTR_0503s0010 [Medicago truncatula]|uniref:Uncharacterized protein n=1 Tax=Medicago truncatula TaxID=3880 RepID=A0A072TEQ3_MEDTR|nr:hypothetical protein MTR_0503s0010 [Medicago truncatula]